MLVRAVFVSCVFLADKGTGYRISDTYNSETEHITNITIQSIIINDHAKVNQNILKNRSEYYYEPEHYDEQEHLNKPEQLMNYLMNIRLSTETL